MSSVTTRQVRGNPVQALGRLTIQLVSVLGDLALFGWEMLGWMLTRLPRGHVLWPNLYQIGVRSIPVVVVTGAFIGMVLAVQTYDQLRMMGLQSRLGSVITISLVKELGPVLAATMLSGRVGSAIAAELGTMKVTEQIDALRALGANPVHYLVVPRFLSCVLLIPLLTIVADSVGIVGGWLFSTKVLGINSHHYWYHADNFVTAYDVFSGIAKSVFFGASIALIACHRGFNCGSGAEGVGKAATQAFVFSFMSILILDFFLGILLTDLYYVLWPGDVSLAGLLWPGQGSVGV